MSNRTVNQEARLRLLNTHCERILTTYKRILPFETDYWVVGVTHSTQEEMQDIAKGRVRGTWQHHGGAQELARKTLAEAKLVLDDIRPINEDLAQEVARRGSGLYLNRDLRNGREGPTILSGVINIIRCKTRK
jgi:hypothetical protein